MTERLSSISARNATRIEFWRELSPELSVEGEALAPQADLANLDRLLELLRVEGYVNEPNVMPPAFVQLLLSAIQRLVAQNIPPAFIYLYDEPWLAFRALSPFLERVLGSNYRLMAGLWAWHVQPSEDDSGWKPHRDGFGASVSKSNLPDAMTVWLALTDATCLNGCIYLVPSHWDATPACSTGRSEEEIVLSDRALQNIRALPATAGSMLVWNHNVIHWGARASSRASNPRCSIALMFRRVEDGPEDPSWLRLHELPPFRRRLGLVGHYVRLYAERFGIPQLQNPHIQALAAALEWKFWRR